MDELAPIVHRQSTVIDWPALSRVVGGGISSQAAAGHMQADLHFAAHTGLGATLLKASRHASLETFVARELRSSLPMVARACRQNGLTWLWQGPHEWLLLSDELDGPSLAARFAAKLSGLTAAAIDVSDRTLVLEISGAAAQSVISRATSMDLSQLEAAGCCRTRFAGLHVSLFKLDRAPSYGLVVDQALSVHLHSWLESVLTSS